jgi:hypothetical protein
MTEETLFELALRTPEAEWAALLDRECEGKPELRARVEALLKADAKPIALEPADGIQATASYTSSDPASGYLIAGKYKLQQQIGECGMGTVWVAEQQSPVKHIHFFDLL